MAFLLSPFSKKAEKKAEQVLPGSGKLRCGGGGTNNVYTCK
jgi:hypothetical protein